MADYSDVSFARFTFTFTLREVQFAGQVVELDPHPEETAPDPRRGGDHVQDAVVVRAQQGRHLLAGRDLTGEALGGQCPEKVIESGLRHTAIFAASAWKGKPCTRPLVSGSGPGPLPAGAARPGVVSAGLRAWQRRTVTPRAKGSTMSEGIADIDIPDTRLVAEATELVREAATPPIFHHSRRVYLFGALRGREQGLRFDPELLYVGAMFHDLGLTSRYRRTDQRFEIDGADEARRFLLGHGIDEQHATRVWTAIALHTTPEIPLHMEPEIALVTRGVELDVLGIGYHAISDAQRAEVVTAHPRPDFKNQILAAFTEGIKDRPETTFGNVKADVLEHFVPGFQRGDFVEVIKNSDWPE
jgi:HD superfamily phosphodiesterase